jgi:hypothetical protein
MTQSLPELDPEAVATFIERFHGLVRQPGDVGYDEARQVRNGMIDRRPAMIAHCAGVADVVQSVNFARDHDILLSVRGGGHNVAGNAVNDGGLVIDLSSMRSVHVDPKARIARVEGGATWADLDRETQLHGLATPGGVVSSTGVGGLTLHGGYGHLRRKHGLSIDNLISAEIVTADGQVRNASADEHADLFWAIRGAGSNFGVVTSFEFRLHPVGPEVFLCAPIYALEDGQAVLRGWRDFVMQAPDEVSSIALCWGVPAIGFPPELARKAIVVTAAVYAGPVEDGERIMQPLRELGSPVLDLSGPHMFAELQGSFDPFFPVGLHLYWKSRYIDDMSDAALDVILEQATRRPSFKDAITLWHLGGAIGRVGTEESAYGRRDAPFLLAAEATWDESAGDEENIAWSRSTLDAMKRFSNGGSYLNFAGFGEEKEAQLRDAYGPNYDRLAMLKGVYDPGNLFRMNLNIKPVH